MSEYWMAACPKCGWVGSSKDCEGGGQIADTGDYAEVVCPKCFKDGEGEWVEIEDAEEYLSASQAREAELREKLKLMTADRDSESRWASEYKQRAEAAEARLTEMQNQEAFRFNQVAELQRELAERTQLLSEAVRDGCMLAEELKNATNTQKEKDAQICDNCPKRGEQ